MAGKRLAAMAAALWLAALGFSVRAAVPDPGLQMPGSIGPSAAVESQAPAAAHVAADALFTTADSCMACHNGLITPSGEDVSIGFEWRASMMANSARDPYWQAAVRREILDHPEAQEEIEDECSICHMPMSTFAARAAGGHGEIFANLPVGQSASPNAALAADGVSCAACHQITPARLGTPESFTGGYVIDTTRGPETRPMFGPFQMDAGLTTLMRSATGFVPTESTHLQSSELCATCHTLYTNALGPGGTTVGRLAEQMPYLEWRHSGYRDSASCQSCHMPVVEEPVAISRVLGQPREGLSRHSFRGGNFFMMRMLNRYRGELGVTALPHEMEAAITRTVQHLQEATARVSMGDVTVSGGRLRAEVTVENLAGHKFPTAYPSRRAWLQFTVRDAAGRVVFESGAFQATGAIAGNDNDEDNARFEPHYLEITRPDQVQIYEAIMAGADGAVTTGLLTGTRYLKDNRLLPAGFDARTASDDIAVRGAAMQDEDFTAGSDRVRYVVDLGGATGPFRVEARLWFQPIAFRWAENLAAYDAFETNRFVRYYRSMSSASALTVATAAR